jgi:hypothetical protein
MSFNHGESFYGKRSPDGDATGIPRLRAPVHGEGFYGMGNGLARVFGPGVTGFFSAAVYSAAVFVLK